MRSHGFLITIALAALAAGASPSKAATFGTVVPIGEDCTLKFLGGAGLEFEFWEDEMYFRQDTGVTKLNVADYVVNKPAVTTVVMSEPDSSSIAVDETYLYWTNPGTDGTDGAVKRTPR